MFHAKKVTIHSPTFQYHLQYIAFCWKSFHEIGFARHVRHLGQVEEQSDHDDDVTLPYMDMCLIM